VHELRIAQLLAKHAADWTRDLRPFDVAPSHCAFHRGLVERVTFTLDALLRFRDYKPASVLLRALDLELPVEAVENLAPILRDVADSPALRALDALSVVGSLECDELRTLFGSPRIHLLRELAIERPSDDLDEELPFGAVFSRLESLAVEATAGALRRMVESDRLPRLRRLSGGIITPDANEDAWVPEWRTLFDSSGMRRVTHLTLCHLAPEVPFILAAARGLTGLTCLELELWQTDARSVGALVSAPWASQLTALAIPRLASDAAEILAQSPSLSRLRWLACSGPVASAGVVALAESPHLSMLRVLSLDVSGVDSAAATSIARSMRHVRSLRLVRSDVGSSGIEALLSMPNLARLELSREEIVRCELGDRTSADRHVLGPRVIECTGER